MAGLAGELRDLFVDAGLARWALRVRRSRPLILMYHGVTHDMTGDVRNAEGKHMPASVFEAQITLLSRHRRLVSLTRLVDDLAAGRDCTNAVAITFDDGYENNFTTALPILLRHQAPATVFLCTGFIGTADWIWTDLLEHTLAGTQVPTLTLPFLAQPLTLGSPRERILACRTLKGALKRMTGDQCRAEIDRIVELLRFDPGTPSGDYRFMNWQQARELAQAGIEMGAHTVSHPILSRVPIEEATAEVLGSRDKVQQELGHCSPVFAYPNGKLDDFTPDVEALCRQHFSAAVSTNRGFASDHERYALRRLSVSDGPSAGRLEWTLLQER